MRYTITIPCPEHPLSGHTATLARHGDKYAGIWECTDTGLSDVCEHKDTRPEKVEVDTTRNGEHDTYVNTIEVCDACECEVT